jgi:hypothetical protein
MAANLKFGLSLASTPFDRIIYGGLSLAADLMKVALPLVTILLWRNGHRIFAAIAGVFCLGLISFSLVAAIGFAASTRGETITANKAVIDSRKAWEAKIERTAQQLDQLGVPPPASVIQAEIDSLLRTPGAGDCTAINGPVTKELCPRVDELRKELAASQRAAQLEADLVADREKLQTVPVAASMRDPQSATLSRLTTLDEGQIRDAIAILIALLVEIGSALGFSFMVLAFRPTRAPQLLAAANDVMETPIAPPPAEPRKLVRSPETPADAVTRWALSRLDVLNAGRIQAEAAYKDFAEWCKGGGMEVCTPQMFGRRFTKVIAGMGGRKMKVNGRAYYEGVTLQDRPAQKKMLAAAA